VGRGFVRELEPFNTKISQIHIGHRWSIDHVLLFFKEKHDLESFNTRPTESLTLVTENVLQFTSRY